MVLGVSSWAYVAVGIAVPLFGFLGLWLDGRRRIERVHDEVRSPNGTKTGEVTYENRKSLIEIREQMAEIREGQLVGWEQAAQHSIRAEAARARLEDKIDKIALVQDDHLNRDEARFQALFAAIDVDDPHA